jgi:hypothetical protein
MAATSADGLDWVISNGGNPVVYPGGRWDRVKCSNPTVIELDEPRGGRSGGTKHAVCFGGTFLMNPCIACQAQEARDKSARALKKTQALKTTVVFFAGAGGRFRMFIEACDGSSEGLFGVWRIASMTTVPAAAAAAAAAAL